MRNFHHHRFAAAVLSLVASASASAVADPSGDFLASFTGTQQGALDITEASVVFNPGTSQFSLSATTAGAIAGAPNVAYVFGFDRGGVPNQPFGSIGFPDVAFNGTAVLRSDGTASVGANALSALIAEQTISAIIDASLLPGISGQSPEDFRWALWSIDSSISGLPRNADFAPSASIAVAVPEPSSWALLGAGLLGMAAVRRRSATR